MKDELKVLKSKYTYYKKSFKEDLKILKTSIEDKQNTLQISTLRVYYTHSLAIVEENLSTIKRLMEDEKNGTLTRAYFNNQKKNITRNQKTLDEKYEEVKELVTKYIDVNKKVVE